MGGLRDRAESERTDREGQHRALVDAQHDEYTERRQQTIQPVLAFLTMWSGEEISESMLEPTGDPSPSELPMGAQRNASIRWLVTIDGFALRVCAYGPFERLAFDIEQSPDGTDLWRIIEEPHQLLAPVQVPDAEAPALLPGQ